MRVYMETSALIALSEADDRVLQDVASRGDLEIIYSDALLNDLHRAQDRERHFAYLESLKPWHCEASPISGREFRLTRISPLDRLATFAVEDRDLAQELMEGLAMLFAGLLRRNGSSPAEVLRSSADQSLSALEKSLLKDTESIDFPTIEAVKLLFSGIRDALDEELVSLDKLNVGGIISDMRAHGVQSERISGVAPPAVIQ